ncbi:hypothetical protein [Prochlorothrix hollandica]|uniref:Glycosyl transferase family 2 n=1 Tax=Prochlorothrix hollandica PCC 9006 = CALU 1027 TaxID=317619 RepID=A0A0M2PZH2_PROHO|nr:hypothetical protein [Prochlorothrix hollandica]KKJ00463.1 hypothetical protein PROH_06755 [Prochlorothrix hollandica PCC 9006 = CALU 1027]
MLVFIIPVKSATVAKDWGSTCRLFQRTLRSTCQQRSPAFRTIVVCNEHPAPQFHHPQVEFLTVDFVPPAKETNPIARGLTDKGRKVLKGLIHARDTAEPTDPPTHAMIVDSDDCVSQRLAGLVQQQPDREGWYLHQGYKYREGDRVLYLKRRNFYRMSGTANIVAFHRLQLPAIPEYNRGYGYYKFYVDHQKVRAMMADRGTPMDSLPFPGAVYVLATGDNMSGNEDNLSFNFLNRRPLTPALAQEFALDTPP